MECVKLSNPNKEIYLLGDKSNEYLAKKLSINHIEFSRYDYGDEITKFESRYKLICGTGFDRVKNGQDWFALLLKDGFWFIIL